MMHRVVLVWLCALTPLCYSKITKSAVDSWEFRRPTVVFNPHELRNIVAGDRRRVYFSIFENNDTDSVSEEAPEKPLSVQVTVVVRPEKPDVVEVTENSTFLLCLKSKDAQNHSFEIKAVSLGYSYVYLDFYVFLRKCSDGDSQSQQNPNDWYEHQNVRNGSPHAVYTYNYLVAVNPTDSLFVHIFNVMMAFMVALNFVNMGCQLDLSSIWEVLKRPVGPVIGFVCQFAFMPLASYGIGYLMFDDPNLRLGLFTLGCSPGGSMSNFWTLLFDGDINLSITMTFISTVAAIGMMPLWIFTLGRHLFRKNKVTLPYLNLIGSLVLLVFPVAIGLLIARYRSNWARFSQKIVRPFTIFCIIIGVTLGLYVNRYIVVLFTWKVIVAGLAVAWIGYLFGALAAFICCLSKPQIVAISIETAFQNGPVAFVMLILSLPQPDAVLTAVPVVAQLVLTGLPMWIIFIALKIIRCFKKHELKDEGKKMVPEGSDN